MPLEKLSELAAYHPYNCNTQSWNNRDAAQEFETWEEFFEEWGSVDKDYNLLFRFDIENLEGEDDEGNDVVYPDIFTGKFFFILQRKGLFFPVTVESLTEADLPAIEKYLSEKWEGMQELWAPFSGKKAVEI